MTTDTSSSTWYAEWKSEDAMAEGHGPVWRHLVSLMPETDLSGAIAIEFECSESVLLRLLYAIQPFAGGLGVDIAAASINKARQLSANLPLNFETADSPAG